MFHFRCDTCDYNRDIDYLPREYVFDDGRRMDMLQRHIWCSQCNSVTVAEALDEDPESRQWRLERRDRGRRELERGDFQHDFEADLLRRWITESEGFDRILAEWQALRTRRQFCLKCGNEDIIVPEKSWADLPHAVCGGTLKCTATIIAATFIGPEPHKYSIDGELLALGYRQGPMEGDQPEPLELWWPEGT